MSEETPDVCTDQTCWQEIIIKQLKMMTDRLDKIDERLDSLEEGYTNSDSQLDQLIADVMQVHTLQKSAGERLALLEGMMNRLPLRSTRPAPTPMPRSKTDEMRRAGNAKRQR